MTPNQHTARRIRSALTEARVDLLRGTKSQIEQIICRELGPDKQANARFDILRALALAVIAMPAGAGVDDPAHTGYNASLRTLAAVMLAKAEGGQ